MLHIGTKRGYFHACHMDTKIPFTSISSKSAVSCQEVQLVPVRFHKVCPGGHRLELMRTGRFCPKCPLSLLRSPVFSAAGMPSVSRNTPVWKTLLRWLVVDGDERQLRTVTVLWHDQGHVTMTLIPISGWPSWQSSLWTY